MLYAQSEGPFSMEAFQHPGSAYRGAPFWAWNTFMTHDMIEKQVQEFRKMGMGGFHIHVRTGLRNRYLSDEFMELIRFAHEKAKENGMLCYLYDEDRYSSGIAGGEVTRHVFYRARWLKLTPAEDDGMLPSMEDLAEKQRRNEKAKGCFLCAYDLAWQDGYLKRASMIGREDPAQGDKWYLYLELAGETAWCNGQTYADTMKPGAVREFIRLTHERYAETVGEGFGVSIPSIFTDEPHISGLRLPERAEGKAEILLPFTEALPEAFGSVGGRDFFSAVPDLVWYRKGEDASEVKYRYYRTLSELFADACCRQIGDWCRAHHLLSTGHLLGEDSVQGGAVSAGDPMRCYREFQIPGIDNLCDHRDFSAAKQASSIARQYGKEGVMSEMYGVTQWDFDFKGYKLAGDWQAALGITLRVPHLAWASMNGESKRDYPAAIGWQSPWYQDFSFLEDHFARVNVCLTRGRPVVRVGILHPVESFWLLQGPEDQSADRQRQLEEDFQSLTHWLLTGGIDFDYLAESSLADETAPQEGDRFVCGEMAYDAVLVPSCLSLRQTTLKRLLAFSDSGGTVIFAGTAPRYADCLPSPELESLEQRSLRPVLTREAVLDALSAWREVEILERGGRRTRSLLHQLREEGNVRWLFLAQAFKGREARGEGVWKRRPEHAPQPLEIRVRGLWTAEAYDTLRGTVLPLSASCRDGWTSIPYDLYGNDSLLLRLERTDRPQSPLPDACPKPALNPLCTLPGPFAYRMSEPNALLLDRFQYALDGEAWQEAEEVLKLDSRLRKRLHLPLRCEDMVQPYIREGEEKRDHCLSLRANITSETALSGCRLALEDAAFCTGTLNGQAIDMTPKGFYVDPALTVVGLPDLRAGNNELCLTFRYGGGSNLEWMYLLGSFGVRLTGAHTALYEKPEQLDWGDLTRQGFPFYTGNLTCLVTLTSGERKTVTLQVPYYAGAAVKARIRGGQEAMLAFLPCTCTLELEKGDNLLEITCLGSRYNGFGPLHLMGDDVVWQGPNAWRTEGVSWTDTYQVRPMGILSAPLLLTETESSTREARMKNGKTDTARTGGRNPFLPLSAYIPDGEPKVFDGRVYLYGSRDVPGGEYCSHLYHVFSAPADDLEEWTDHGPVFASTDEAVPEGIPDGVPWSDSLLYAPDAVRRGDTYYLYFCLSDGSEGVAESSRPEGPFANARRVTMGGEPISGIDPSVLEDGGRYYYTWGQGQCHMARLMDDMCTLDPATYREALISNAEGAEGFHEGSSLRKVGDWYTLVYASEYTLSFPNRRGTPTCLDYAVSRRIEGPYERRGTIIDNTGIDPRSWNNHGSIIRIGEQWYVFYHGSSGCSPYGRRARVERIRVDEENGFIHTSEMTSSGFARSLAVKEDLPAACAYRLWGGAFCTEKEGCYPLVHLGNGTAAGFRYFDFGAADSRWTITLKGVCLQGGTVIIAVNGTETARIVTETAGPFEESAVLEHLQGKTEIRLLFQAEHDAEILELDAVRLSPA